MISNGLSIQISFEMLNLSWQTVSFTSIFSEAPFVIVSGSHSTHHGSLPIEHNSIATWVEVRRETHFVIYWEIFPNSARSHWLLWGHMTSNNETVFCQNLWAGNIAKSMTSEGNSREIKIHFYRKRQKSDSSREFLRIENNQIKTVPNNSYG